MTAPDPAVRSDATDGPLTVPALLADFAARGEHPLFVTPSDRLTYVEDPLRALDGADCLVIVTEWGDYRRPDFDEMATRLAARVIFDGRNLYTPAEMQSRGFTYHCIGKRPVRPG